MTICRRLFCTALRISLFSLLQHLSPTTTHHATGTAPNQRCENAAVRVLAWARVCSLSLSALFHELRLQTALQHFDLPFDCSALCLIATKPLVTGYTPIRRRECPLLTVAAFETDSMRQTPQKRSHAAHLQRQDEATQDEAREHIRRKFEQRASLLPCSRPPTRQTHPKPPTPPQPRPRPACPPAPPQPPPSPLLPGRRQHPLHRRRLQQRRRLHRALPRRRHRLVHQLRDGVGAGQAQQARPQVDEVQLQLAQAGATEGGEADALDQGLEARGGDGAQEGGLVLRGWVGGLGDGGWFGGGLVGCVCRRLEGRVGFEE